MLADGYIIESIDGECVAPLMGAYADANVGTLRLRMLPNFWNHSRCDHAVSTQVMASGPHLTMVRVHWPVDAQAQESKHYRLDTLLPFWQLTSEQD